MKDKQTVIFVARADLPISRIQLSGQLLSEVRYWAVIRCLAASAPGPLDPQHTLLATSVFLAQLIKMSDWQKISDFGAQAFHKLNNC